MNRRVGVNNVASQANALKRGARRCPILSAASPRQNAPAHRRPTEAEQISQRTTAALAAKKKRGVKLGSSRPGHWDGKEDHSKARTAAAKAHSETCDDEYADLFPVVKELKEAGSSLQAIAEELNKQGHTTRRGKPWNRMQVSRVLKRAA